MMRGYAALAARQLSGWRGLGIFWAVVLALLGGGAGVLAWLGPPPARAGDGRGGAGRADARQRHARPATTRRHATAPEPPPIVEATLRGAARPAGPTPAAEPALLEAGPHGRLPRIGPDGRSSIRTYGRPFDRADPRPRVGLVIGGLGMNAAVTEEAIAPPARQRCPRLQPLCPAGRAAARPGPRQGAGAAAGAAAGADRLSR